MSKGRIFVLDGLDGCGKTTQFELLRDRLQEKNVPLQAVSFPEYDKPSAALVKMYLGGDFAASPDGVNAYAASSFYAVDRYASYKLYWEKAYNEGKLILASRYTTSNAIHQMSKLPESQWDEYLEWLEDYEYNKLGLPRPDCVVFLSLPLEISQRLLSNRYDGDEDKKDIHEADLKYLTECRISAEYAAKRLGWHIIDCSENGEIRTIESIHEELRRLLGEVNL